MQPHAIAMYTQRLRLSYVCVCARRRPLPLSSRFRDNFKLTKLCSSTTQDDGLPSAGATASRIFGFPDGSHAATPTAAGSASVAFRGTEPAADDEVSSVSLVAKLAPAAVLSAGFSEDEDSDDGDSLDLRLTPEDSMMPPFPSLARTTPCPLQPLPKQTCHADVSEMGATSCSELSARCAALLAGGGGYYYYYYYDTE